LSNIGAGMEDLDDLRATTKQHSDRIRTMETAVKSFEKVAEQVGKNQRYLFGNGSVGLDERVRIQESVAIRHEKSFDKLQKFAEDLQPVVMFYKVGVWFAGILGAAIVALIWSLITGQWEILIK